MTTPVRIKRERTKGWKMPDNTIYVGRPTIFGNPFPLDVYGHERAVDLYRRWLEGNMSSAELDGLSRSDRWSDPPAVSLIHVRNWLRKELPNLIGKNLACWCPLDHPCHADVLLEIAKKELETNE